MKNLNSRQRILNYITEQQSSTVEELSKVFRVSPANIRHHLSILSEQGSIMVIGQNPPKGKGRPSLIYSSKPEMEKNNYELLTDALLCSLLCESNPSKIKDLIDNLARHISLKINIDNSNPTRRLYSAIQALNRMNYHAHWEAHVRYPRIMLGRCPYQANLNNHPELCEMDLSLMELLLGTHVRQIEKQCLTAKGIPQCVFLISEYSA